MIDWTEVGKMPMPTKAQLKREGNTVWVDGVDTSNPMYTDGLRTRDRKAYDAKRYLEKIADGRLTPFKYPRRSYKGEANPNWKGGIWLDKQRRV